MFLVAFPYEWLVLAYASDFSKFCQTSNIWLQQALYFHVAPGPALAAASLGSQLVFS